MSRSTIRDVAAAAGVSRQTVSRVLNERPDVAPETRQRVQDVIKRLGYQPSSLARSLTQGRSYTLGVVSYGVQYFGPANTLVGIEHQASEMGYTVHLRLVRNPSEGSVHILRDMLSYHVDGVLWAVSEIGDNRDWTENEICQLTVPVVFLDTQSCPNLSVVNVDNRLGGYIATRHLLEQGYRVIGLITGPLDWWSARQRKLGWQEALHEAGLIADDGLVVEGTWSAASGQRGLRRLLEQYPEIEAVFACNDQMALGVMKEAGKSGRRIPDDLAVVGFDDVPEAAFFCPSLSTVRQDLNELGRTAVRELDRLIRAAQQGEPAGEPKAILLEPQLLVRESSAVHEIDPL
jgi:LacI family transcriptional regulator